MKPCGECGWRGHHDPRCSHALPRLERDPWWPWTIYRVDEPLRREQTSSRAQAIAQQVRDCNLDGEAICHLLGLARDAGLLVDVMWAIHGTRSINAPDRLMVHAWARTIEKIILRLDNGERRIELRLERRDGLAHLDKGARRSILYFLADGLEDDTGDVVGRLPFLGAYLDDPDLAWHALGF